MMILLPVLAAALTLTWIVYLNLKTLNIRNGPVIILAICFLVYGGLALPFDTLLVHIGFGVGALILAIAFTKVIGGGTAKIGAVAVLWLLPTYYGDAVLVIFIISCFATAGIAKLLEGKGIGAPATVMFAPVLYYVFYQIGAPVLLG